MTLSDERTYNAMRCLDDFQLFVKRMFRAVYNTDYLLGTHHSQICSALRRVGNGECKRLIINIAPRYGKTLLVSQMFIAWGFALNPYSKFIHLSYSRDLVRANAQAVRDIIESDYYQWLYGERVRVIGKSSANWATSVGGKMYAVSSGGQVTGFGAGAIESEEDEITDSDFPRQSSGFAGAIVLDDPLKPDDALSDKAREFVNQRFENTIRSRANSRNTPIVIIMQRLHEDDLCGNLLKREGEQWEVLSLPCIYTDSDGREKALWENKHTIKELQHLQMLDDYVFQTQYMQNPRPLSGLLYERFKEYETLPVDGRFVVKCYCDTADTGKDFLCAIIYNEYSNGECFVRDILYTDKDMEYTENELTRMLLRNDVAVVNIESNNGGRGFRRNVERLVREQGNRQMRFVDFTQTLNKQVRIFNNSSAVQNMIYFPKGWQDRFYNYFVAMSSYRKAGRNAHDDAPDATTGIIEKITPKNTTKISRT